MEGDTKKTDWCYRSKSSTKSSLGFTIIKGNSLFFLFTGIFLQNIKTKEEKNVKYWHGKNWECKRLQKGMLKMPKRNGKDG
jgi:hypothetical protein